VLYASASLCCRRGNRGVSTGITGNESGGPLLSIIGGPVCGLAFGAVMAACTIAVEVSDKK